MIAAKLAALGITGSTPLATTAAPSRILRRRVLQGRSG